MKISIITPNYNYAHFIGETIESVVNQNYKNLEHIIVDDGSTDNSVNVIKSYQEKYPSRIKLIQQENKGQTPAINVGLQAATGDILGWINSDDYYNKNVFGLIADCFRKETNVDAVFGDIGIIDENNRIIRINKYLKFDYASGVFNDFGKVIPSNAIFWKKGLTQQAGLMDENFVYAMDSEYWSRLLFNRNVKKIKLVVAYFRWHPKAKTIKSHDKLSSDNIRATAERKIIFRKAYLNLVISRIIPYHFSRPLYIYYRFKRLLFRGIMGEYFK